MSYREDDKTKLVALVDKYQSGEMIHVYVAGPLLTSGVPWQNVRRAVDAGTTLKSRGFYPFVPHLLMYWDMLNPIGETGAMRADLAWILRCDLLLRLPGASTGADIEVDWARQHGLPVLQDLGAMLALFDAVEDGRPRPQGTHAALETILHARFWERYTAPNLRARHSSDLFPVARSPLNAPVRPPPASEEP